jgi:uncharacterized protein YbbK (DUF523 family)
VPTSPDDRPRVGISRCLLGDEVRYDGGHKRDAFLVDILGGLVQWVPVCPEVEIGMGTPREPIHLVAAPDGAASGAHRVRLLGVHSKRDWTERAGAWSRGRIDDLRSTHLAGFVLKANSPSCGIDGVPIEDGGGAEAGTGRGLFAQALIEALPDLPIEDERRLADPAIREAFIARVFAHHRAHTAQRHR